MISLVIPVYSFIHAYLVSLSVQIERVIYSNDGTSKTLTVSVDWTFIGTFNTHSHTDFGRLWNTFLPSPLFTRTLALDPGWHSLRLRVWGGRPGEGVEIDRVVMIVNDEGAEMCVTVYYKMPDTINNSII
jgi:hypothetical protein